MRFVAACLGAVVLVLTVLTAHGAVVTDDPFAWLEDVDGDRALDWVLGQNAITGKMLKSDAGYAEAESQALGLLTAPDRIAYPTLAGGQVFNFWQDPSRPRGLWRRTSLVDYERSKAAWETLLDLDQLSKAQNENWVWKGASCLPPLYQRCLVKLSHAGRDAIVVREFDVAKRAFVPGGFTVGEAKTEIAWVDQNAVLVATNWGPDTLTRSGYPRTVKLWRRGQPSHDGVTIYQGDASDVVVAPRTSFGGGKPERFIVRALGGFGAELFRLDDQGRATRISVPSFADFKGLYRGQLVFALTRDWRVGGRNFLQGSVVSFSLEAYLNAGGALPAIQTLFMPDAKSAVTAVAIARDAVYVAALENVKGRLHELTLDGAGWRRRRVALPDDGAVEIIAASEVDDGVMVKFSSFTTPETLYAVSLESEPRVIRRLPDRFDADAIEVTQYEATSSDGAKVPYFLVHAEGASDDGDTPTLLYAYGGFQVSTTPWYWSSAGKLWLEKGGAYAIANVRGGGEFGPRWHNAAIGLNHQRNFDDLAAVARDLIARKITAPRRLGVMGASQGGLLAAATFVQNPTLFNAVVAQVPLADMLRYPQLSAGASWLAEYGDPSDPVQRAAILRWSPYQNIKSGIRYPRALLLGATHDDRVHPAHARKLAAKLQANGQSYYYFETLTAGHDATNAPRQRAEQLALTFTYLRQQLMD